MKRTHAPIEGMTDTALLAAYSGTARKIAYSLITKLPPNIEVDDLVQEGMVALLQASSRFKLDQGATFETFASQRIRGAMLDYLRREDLLSGRNVRKIGKLSRVINGFEHIDRGALAHALDLTLPQLEELLIARDSYAVSENDPALEDGDGGSLLDQVPSQEQDPLEMVEVLELVKRIELALERHARRAKSERIYTIFQLYFEGESLSDIACFLGVHKVRVHQIVTGIRNSVMRGNYCKSVE